MTDRQNFSFNNVQDPAARQAFAQLAKIIGGLTGLNDATPAKVRAVLSMATLARANSLYLETLSAPPSNPRPGQIAKPDGDKWAPAGADGQKIFYYDGPSGTWKKVLTGGGGGSGSGSGSFVEAQASATTNVGASAYVKVNLANVITDALGEFATSTFTALYDGFYVAAGGVLVSGPGSSGNRMAASIFKNGSQLSTGSYIIHDQNSAHCSVCFYGGFLAAGGTFDLRCYSEKTTTAGSGGSTYLTVFSVG